MINPYQDLQKLSDPYGNKAVFLDEKTPFENAEDELKRIQEDIYNPKNLFRDDPYKEITPLDKLRRGYSTLESAPELQDYIQPNVIDIS